MRRALAPLSIAASLLASAPAFAQVDHLEVLQTPQLVDCDTRPFFRVAVSPVDAERRPVGVNVGSGDVRQLFQVSDGDRIHKTVYVSTPGSTTSTRGSYVMVLFDTSGSMNLRLPSGQTRFVAAKAAVRQSLGNFTDGADYMAVVPFDSRNVATRIRAARFDSTRRGVESQIDTLPTPTTGNTALFSAVLEALPILKERLDAGSPVQLILFTDGENDVGKPGDDPGLLGNDGLTRVREAARLAKVPITTVGFGVTSNAAAQLALRGIAFPTPESFYDAATNVQRVTEIFESTRRKMSDRFVVLFGPVRDRRDQLTGQSVQFNVKFKNGTGIVSSRQEPTWGAPAVGVAVADASCTEAEARAIVAMPGNGGQPPEQTGLKRIIIFVTFATALGGLWFGAPRMMWPDRYVPRPNLNVNSYIPPTPAGVPQPYIPQPRMPQLDLPRGGPVMGGAAASDRPRPPAPQGPPPGRPSPPQGGARPAQPTIVIPPRGQGGGAQPRPAPRAPEPRPREASDETLYQPPPKPPRLD